MSAQEDGVMRHLKRKHVALCHEQSTSTLIVIEHFGPDPIFLGKEASFLIISPSWDYLGFFIILVYQERIVLASQADR